MGRSPIGEHAMTGAERVRLWRQRHHKTKGKETDNGMTLSLGGDARSIAAALYAHDPVTALNVAATIQDYVTVDDLSAEEKSKVDRAIKQQLKKLQGGFYEAVKKENQQFVERMHADWKRKVEFAEKYGGGSLSVQREKFPFTRKQFKELLFFTHPDRQDESLRERAAEIFSAVKSKEDSLVMPDPPSGGPSFPASPDDLLRTRSKTK